MSGKTKLAQRLANDAATSGGKVIVYDPLRSRGWPDSAIKFHRADAFLSSIGEHQSAFVFIDESKTLWSHDMVAADRLVYTGRHSGFKLFLIAQRAHMVPPNARNQCATVYAFKQQEGDARILNDQYDPALYDSTKLEKINFIVSDGFSHRRGKLDFSAGDPPALIPA